MQSIYDNIGIGYSKHRTADPRIVAAIIAAIGLNPPAVLSDIGADTGNYSRAMGDMGYHICAVEPSDIMHGQAVSHASVQWCYGTSEDIPLPNHYVDGIFCLLAAHHFSSIELALDEMARVSSGPILWFTFDPRQAEDPWIRDYFPTTWESAFGVFPPIEDICRFFEVQTHRHVTVTPFLLPHDLEDCFLAAGWRRPEMYLDADVRACMSAFALADEAVVADGLMRLRHDIETGAWKAAYGHLLTQDTIDWGYRFLCAA